MATYIENIDRHFNVGVPIINNIIDTVVANVKETIDAVALKHIIYLI